METERIKLAEEEIQVLTAQVNAYSRECEKQKGLVAQNQERHKTEVCMYHTIRNFDSCKFCINNFHDLLLAAIVILH